MTPPTPTADPNTTVPSSATAAPPDPEGSRPCHDPSGSGSGRSGSVGRSGPTIAALALLAAAPLAHLIVAHNGPTWTSPLLIGDWLFNLLLALAIPTYALALGRRIARPLLDPEADADGLGESLAALGLGLGALSLATLALGLLRLYHGPLFLILWLALTLWLRPELRRIWAQAAHRTARWLRSGMPSAPTLPQRLALLVLLLTVPSVLLRTAAPVTEWDAVIYHLASLKLYLAANGIIPLPDLPPANEPSGAEMLLLPSLMAGADGVGKLLNPICALLMGIATYNLGRRYLGPATAWIGVLLFFSPLWLQLVLPLTLTDFASSLLGLLAVADVADWTRRTAHTDPSPHPHLQHTTPPNATSSHPDPSGSGSPPSSPSSYKSSMHAAEQPAPAAPESVAPNPPTAVAPSLPFDRSRRPHGHSRSSRRPHAAAHSDRLLIRAGLFAGLSVSFKLTSAPAIPTLAITIGLAALLVCRGTPLARLLWATRNGTLATVAAAIPLAPWLLKTRYFFGHFFYAVSVQVSNPSDGVIVASTAPSRLDHTLWVATTFCGLLWNHLGPLSLALFIAPLLLRRPEQRALLAYFLIGSILWLLLVPYYEPPRYFISLVALAAALIAGSLGAALTALRSRPLPTTPAIEHSATSPPHHPSGHTTAPQLLPLLLGGFLVLQALPGLFLGLRFFDDAQARAVATGRLSRHDYLAAHLPAYLALIYANDHLPTTARIALVNVVSGYYLDRPHLNEWYGTTLTALQAGDASRDAVRASWCQGRYTYLILDRADGSLDNNTRTGVHPRTTFTWLRIPGLAPRLLYTARAVDVYAIHPCR